MSVAEKHQPQLCLQLNILANEVGGKEVVGVSISPHTVECLMSLYLHLIPRFP